MKAENKFANLPLEFWANVRLISQAIGYTDRQTSRIKAPTLLEIQSAFNKLSLNSNKIVKDNKTTPFGELLIGYFNYRADFLNNYVEPNLLNKSEAKKIFIDLKKRLKPSCPLPMNKQKGKKKTYAYFTGIINMLIEKNGKGFECDYNPKELTIFTKDNFPSVCLSRRFDGAFPNVINPIALWEIKEYYNTTTFGSRVADGIYESLLDGYELASTEEQIGRKINHYLMIDDYYTWWTLGKSYLCRICDMLNIGFLTEVLVGKEVIDRVPKLVNEWVNQLKK